LQGRTQGSTGLANLIVAESIRPDVFIGVTPGPMHTVLGAGKAQRALPVARTEMVIAYSPKSQYAPLLAQANKPGAKPWWQILATQGLCFGRPDSDEAYQKRAEAYRKRGELDLDRDDPPFFMEEMVQALFEEGAIQRNGTVKLIVFFSAPALA
jgi:Bacterial extracellular solute-binding protein